MRPYAMTPDRGLQPDPAVALYAKRDTMRPKFWRLAWMRPGASTYVYDDGECSPRLFRTRRAAVAAGQRDYNETARRWED